MIFFHFIYYCSISRCTVSSFTDAASVVLYHTFEAMANMPVVTFKEVRFMTFIPLGPKSTEILTQF